ncbi:ComF family protein [Marinilactibacillus sp. GCM10026970]|uniref:ComF family protein n=1 Tax=Marinilactibacillus sp. GCM10026970 TaxID=3252642 RepID=UPI003616880B
MTRCIWCGQQITSKLTISDLFTFKKLKAQSACASCYSKLEKISGNPSCPFCSRVQETTEVCQDCQKWIKASKIESLNHKALYTYNAFAKEWMERYKFTGDIRVARMISEDLIKAIGSMSAIDMIVPIPISKRSFQIRGFNQTEIMLKTARIPYTNLLENTTTEKNQSKKTRQERLQSIQPFCMADHNKESIKGKNVLVIDDVYTTGRTMIYAMEYLLSEGAKDVQSLSVFR